MITLITLISNWQNLKRYNEEHLTAPNNSKLLSALEAAGLAPTIEMIGMPPESLDFRCIQSMQVPVLTVSLGKIFTSESSIRTKGSIDLG